MPVTEFDVKSLVLRMLDDVNKPGNSNFNNYWWNYVSPSKQADFVHVDSVGRFYVGREQVEAAFNGAAKLGHLHLGLTSDITVQLDVVPGGVHTAIYEARLWRDPPVPGLPSGMNAVLFATIDDDCMLTSLCTGDADAAAADYDEALRNMYLKAIGAPEGGYPEARALYERGLGLPPQGWEVARAFFTDDLVLFDGMRLVRGQDAISRMETIYDHLTSMRLTGPITTFSPTSASAPVARTAKNFPEAPPATLGCTFEGEKVKVMVLGARSKEGQMWKNKQVKKLEEIIRETKN